MIREYLDFFRGFLSRPGATGAVAPSSRELAQTMVRPFDLKGASLVVEIGPGTGAITDVILEEIGDPSHYMGLELNPDFVRQLQARFPTATFHNGSAEDIERYVAQRNSASVDYVVSGLPWAIFGQDLQERILHGITSVLREGGGFSTFAYVHGLQLGPAKRFRKRLDGLFSKVEVSRVVWKNFPPAVAYYCIR
jgi:phosphatidylethanolamine/phosphatidyl-N-methylethanolamine N-methyltransferase